MRVVVLAAVALTGCAGPDMLPRPMEGYQAIRFHEPVRIPGPFGAYEIGAGTVLVADRAVGAKPLFCGTVQFRDILSTLVPTCASYAGGILTMNADKAVTGTPFRAPPSAIEDFRLR